MPATSPTARSTNDVSRSRRWALRTPTLQRVYITGNHEYFSGALEWVEHMTELGWTVLHNRHLIVERAGARLAIAGTDDLTAGGSGVPGHRSDLPAALRGVPSDVPVMLVAHQPKEVREAAAAGVDLQLSGHTHGGQIWPFQLIVRAEQGALQGLSRHRPANAAVHHPRRRVLGAAVPGVRAERDQPAHAAVGRRPAARRLTGFQPEAGAAASASSVVFIPSAAGSPSFSNIGATTGVASLASPFKVNSAL